MQDQEEAYNEACNEEGDVQLVASSPVEFRELATTTAGAIPGSLQSAHSWLSAKEDANEPVYLVTDGALEPLPTTHDALRCMVLNHVIGTLLSLQQMLDEGPCTTLPHALTAIEAAITELFQTRKRHLR